MKVTFILSSTNFYNFRRLLSLSTSPMFHKDVFLHYCYHKAKTWDHLSIISNSLVKRGLKRKLLTFHFSLLNHLYMKKRCSSSHNLLLRGLNDLAPSFTSNLYFRIVDMQFEDSKICFPRQGLNYPDNKLG